MNARKEKERTAAIAVLERLHSSAPKSAQQCLKPFLRSALNPQGGEILPKRPPKEVP